MIFTLSLNPNSNSSRSCSMPWKASPYPGCPGGLHLAFWLTVGLLRGDSSQRAWGRKKVRLELFKFSFCQVARHCLQPKVLARLPLERSSHWCTSGLLLCSPAGDLAGGWQAPCRGEAGCCMIPYWVPQSHELLCLFIQCTSMYPVCVCHLFPARILVYRTRSSFWST